MPQTLRSFLKHAASLAAVAVLVGSLALSACAIPVLLVALFWLG